MGNEWSLTGNVFMIENHYFMGFIFHHIHTFSCISHFHHPFAFFIDQISGEMRDPIRSGTEAGFKVILAGVRCLINVILANFKCNSLMFFLFEFFV